MGSYNRKKCAKPECQSKIYDGATFCWAHQQLVFSIPDSHVSLVQDGAYRTITIGRTSPVSALEEVTIRMRVEDLTNALRSLGWDVTPPNDRW